MGLILNQFSDINYRHPLMRGIVSRWKVVPNFVGGSRFVDLCGRNHGVLTNGPLWSSAMGRPGGSGSILFNAANQYITCPGLANIIGGRNKLSWSTWVYHSSLNNNSFLVRNSLSFDVTTNGSARTVVLIRRTTGGNLTILEVVSPAVVAGRWMHIAVTLNGDGDNAVYYNGKEVLRNSTTFDSFDAATDGTFNIGDSAGNLRGFIDDQIIDVSRSWSASEVAALYQATRQQYDPTLNYDYYNHLINFNRFQYNYLSIKVPSLGYLSMRG